MTHPHPDDGTQAYVIDRIELAFQSDGHPPPDWLPGGRHPYLILEIVPSGEIDEMGDVVAKLLLSYGGTPYDSPQTVLTMLAHAAHQIDHLINADPS